MTEEKRVYKQIVFEEVENGYKGSTRKQNRMLDHWVFNSLDELIMFIYEYLEEDWKSE